MTTGFLTFFSLFAFPSLPLSAMALAVLAPCLLMSPGYYRALTISAAGYRFRESRFKKATAAARSLVLDSNGGSEQNGVTGEPPDSELDGLGSYGTVVTL